MTASDTHWLHVAPRDSLRRQRTVTPANRRRQATPSRLRGSPDLDRGAVAPFVMLLCVALFAVFALVVDGGRALSARETASAEAEQAARVGAAQLSVSSVHAGSTNFQVANAIAAAERYMAATGHPGYAAVIGTSLVATVRTYGLATPLLALVGVNDVSVSGSAAATAVAG